jgi:hypothetical protein
MILVRYMAGRTERNVNSYLFRAFLGTMNLPSLAPQAEHGRLLRIPRRRDKTKRYRCLQMIALS